MTQEFFVWVSLSLFLISIPGIAAERPKLPEPGVDTVLTGGKSAREFFAERTKDSPCRRELLDLRAKYREESEKFEKMKKDAATVAALDDQGLNVEKAKRAVVLKNNECGECAARPVARTVINDVGRTEVWYVSDGSCQLPITNPQELSKAYEQLRDAILRVKKYPHYADGLHHILELKAVDTKTGQWLNDKDLLDNDPQGIFVSIRGPQLFGLVTAFSYLCEVKWAESLRGEQKQLVLTGTGVRPPSGFNYPEVYSYQGGGGKTAIPEKRQKKASALLKMWYLTQDGYLRYFTAADFGASISFIDQLGQEVMLDSVFSQYRRVIAD